MSSDYFIGSMPTTPTTAFSNMELDKMYKNNHMETIIDSTIISGENSEEMFMSSRPQSDHEKIVAELDDPILLGTAGDVIVGMNSFVDPPHLPLRVALSMNVHADVFLSLYVFVPT